ncbi:MAG: Hint domain-containing protein [Pseudomonadota bacterium]
MTDITLDETYAGEGAGIIDIENESADIITIYVTAQWVAQGDPVAFQVDDEDTVYLEVSGPGDFSTAPNEPAGYIVTVSGGGQSANNGLAILGGSTTNNICFTRGARVATPSGPVAIEDLQAGDLVLTRDHGAQAIRWIGASKVSAETLAQFPALRPVTIAAGTFGDNAETTVSPAHRVLVDGWRAEALFGEGEVLATAASLVNDTTIRRAEASEVEYFHMMFDAHELVLVDGLWSESFHPAAVNATLAPATRDEVLELFPELEADAAVPAARRSVAAADVAVLF